MEGNPGSPDRQPEWTDAQLDAAHAKADEELLRVAQNRPHIPGAEMDAMLSRAFATGHVATGANPRNSIGLHELGASGDEVQRAFTGVIIGRTVLGLTFDAEVITLDAHGEPHIAPELARIVQNRLNPQPQHKLTQAQAEDIQRWGGEGALSTLLSPGEYRALDS